MRLVSPLLKHVVYPCLATTGCLHNAVRQPNLRVVTYHGVLPEGYKIQNAELDGGLVSAGTLHRQLRLLKSRYHVISPEEFFFWCSTRKPLPSCSVLLTCDDGLLNNLTDMLPVLQAEGLQCLFFVTGASLTDKRRMLWHEQLHLMLHIVHQRGTACVMDWVCESSISSSPRDQSSLWWSMVNSLSQIDAASRDEFLDTARVRLRLPEDWSQQWVNDPVYCRRFFTLTPAEIQQLVAAGMSIGAHTLSHPVLSQLPAQSAWLEIAESRRSLEDALHTPISAMAYPFGDGNSVSHREFEMAERSGYTCAFLNVEGAIAEQCSLFALPRVHVTATMSLAEFEAHVSGFHHALRQRLAGLQFAAATLGS